MLSEFHDYILIHPRDNRPAAQALLRGLTASVSPVDYELMEEYLRESQSNEHAYLYLQEAAYQAAIITVDGIFTSKNNKGNHSAFLILEKKDGEIKTAERFYKCLSNSLKNFRPLCDDPEEIQKKFDTINTLMPELIKNSLLAMANDILAKWTESELACYLIIKNFYDKSAFISRIVDMDYYHVHDRAYTIFIKYFLNEELKKEIANGMEDPGLIIELDLDKCKSSLRQDRRALGSGSELKKC